jgi:hypothetical protein
MVPWAHVLDAVPLGSTMPFVSGSIIDGSFAAALQ